MNSTETLEERNGGGAVAAAGLGSGDGELLSRETDPRVSALLQVVSDFVFLVRQDGAILNFQNSRHTEFQFPATLVVGRSVLDLLPAGIGNEAMAQLNETLSTGQPQHFSCHHPMPGGFNHFEVRLAVWREGEVVVMVRDVTERHMLQKELLEISQRERNRIGQDLHDGLGQHLTGISFLSKALRNKLRAKGLPEAEEALEIGQQVIQALSQTRNLARGLFPVEVEVHGLQAALQELAATAEERFDITCSLECDDGIRIDDESDATHLFRLAQEAISNSVKHGKAKAVGIALKDLGDRLELSIVDNGIGFVVPGPGQKGLGLRIMNYRAQKVDGELEIGCGPTCGTVVRCVFKKRIGVARI